MKSVIILLPRILVFFRKFSGYCSDKCSKSSEETKQKRKYTNLIKYGCEYPAQNNSILKKMQNACIKKYGVTNPGAVIEVKEKVRKTCLKHFGVPYSSQSYQHKELYRNKNFVINFTNKQYLTHKKNNSFHTSKPEEECYELLKMDFPNIIHHYRSEKYPFNCDFYIPEKDLYIEFN